MPDESAPCLNPSSPRARATARLVARIHLLSQTAKLALDVASRRTAYRHKTLAVLHLAKLYPDEVWVEDMEVQAGGAWLFSLRGYRLGGIHLLTRNPHEVLATISISRHLRNRRADHPRGIS